MSLQILHCKARDIAARYSIWRRAVKTNRQLTRTGREYQEILNPSPSLSVPVRGKKFMLTLRDSVYGELVKAASQRGVNIQGLIRAVIVPEWQKDHSDTTKDLVGGEPLGTPRIESLREIASDQFGARDLRTRSSGKRLVSAPVGG